MEDQAGVTVADFVTWLNALELEKAVSSETLVTGRCIAEALHKIDAQFFKQDFLERIPDYGTDVSFHLKKNNLHKIFLRLSEFYKDRLDANLTEKWIIDFRNEAEETISRRICQLLSLVLAASVMYGENQKHFISLLLEQSSALQMTAMNTVQEVKTLMPESSGLAEGKGFGTATSVSASSSVDEINELKLRFERISKENQRLLQQVKEIKEERDQLAEQNKTLHTDLEELGGSSNEAENLRKQLRAAHTVKESIQDSLYKVEAERDHFKKLSEDTAKENAELLEKLQSLAPLEEDCRRAKDELEEVRLRSLEFDKVNSQVETYKTKLKDYNTLKVEMKVMEEKLGTYMQSVIALEDEQRKNGALKTQIESLRLENDEISKKLREESRRADKAEFESKRLSERLKDTEKSKNEFRDECRQLNEKILLQSDASPSKASFSSLHEETMEAGSLPLQERVLKLEKENALLHAKEGDQIILIKEEMNVMAEKKAELESELNWSQRRILELEAKLKDAEESLTKGEGLNENRFTEQQTAKEKLALSVAQLQARLEQANKNNEVLAAEKESLKEELETAKRDVAAEKEKLRGYMEKARRVIDDVEKQNRAVESGALSRHEFDAIRRERDSYKQAMDALKDNVEKNRTMQEEEQRLITSLVHEVMMERQQSSRSEDSMRANFPSTPERSFLARQRQCCNFSSGVIIMLLAVVSLLLLLWPSVAILSSGCCEDNELPPY